jgi:hypothetical protein
MKTQQSPSFEADYSDNGMKMTTFWDTRRFISEGWL